MSISTSTLGRTTTTNKRGAAPSDAELETDRLLLREHTRATRLNEMRTSFARLTNDELGRFFFPRGPLGGSPLRPPRESLNRFLFSGDETALTNELLDDLPLKLGNWYPTEETKMRENLKLWVAAMDWVEATLYNSSSSSEVADGPRGMVVEDERHDGDDWRRVLRQCRRKLLKADVVDEKAETVTEGEDRTEVGRSLSDEDVVDRGFEVRSAGEGSANGRPGDHDGGGHGRGPVGGGGPGNAEVVHQPAEKQEDDTAEDVMISPNRLRAVAREAIAPFAGPAGRKIAKAMQSARARALEDLDISIDGGPGDDCRWTLDVEYQPRRSLYVLTGTRVLVRDRSVENHDEEDVVFEEDPVNVSEWALRKLSSLYTGPSDLFYAHVYCCCKRYEALCGWRAGAVGPCVEGGPRGISAQQDIGAAELGAVSEGDASSCSWSTRTSSSFTGERENKGSISQKEGQGLQAAIPPTFFARLPRNTVECFASPFNKSEHSAAYHSFFEDDKIFSSRGDWFQWSIVKPPSMVDQVVEASKAGAAPDIAPSQDHHDPEQDEQELFFEANPPFDVTVIERTVKRIEALLEQTEKKASFLLVVPEWLPQGDFRPTGPIALIKEGRYHKASIIKRPHRHQYVKGRCWDWGGLPLERGPPVSPGVSKSRAALFSNWMSEVEAAEFLARAVEGWESKK